MDLASDWQEEEVSELGGKGNGFVKKRLKPLLHGAIDAAQARQISPAMAQALDEVVVAAAAFPAQMEQEIPGSVLRQRAVVDQLEGEIANTAIAAEGEGDLILRALSFAAAQRDPLAFVAGGALDSDTGTGGGGRSGMQQQSEIYAWRQFLSVLGVLRQVGALEGPDGTNATALGAAVGSLSADNELWLALVLQDKALLQLEAPALAAAVSATTMDSYKASTAFMKYKPSAEVEAAYDEMAQLARRVERLQAEAGIAFPIHLTRETVRLDLFSVFFFALLFGGRLLVAVVDLSLYLSFSLFFSPFSSFFFLFLSSHGTISVLPHPRPSIPHTHATHIPYREA